MSSTCDHIDKNASVNAGVNSAGELTVLPPCGQRNVQKNKAHAQGKISLNDRIYITRTVRID